MGKNLTPELVKEIRRHLVANRTFEWIAIRYGVHEEVIRNIAAGRTWKKVKCENQERVRSMYKAKELNNFTYKRRLVLTDEKVIAIRERLVAYEPIQCISEKYGVSSDVIRSVYFGRTWDHVDCPNRIVLKERVAKENRIIAYRKKHGHIYARLTKKGVARIWTATQGTDIPHETLAEIFMVPKELVTKISKLISYEDAYNPWIGLTLNG